MLNDTLLLVILTVLFINILDQSFWFEWNFFMNFCAGRMGSLLYIMAGSFLVILSLFFLGSPFVVIYDQSWRAKLCISQQLGMKSIMSWPLQKNFFPSIF